jgi:hypothetical protein
VSATKDSAGESVCATGRSATASRSGQVGPVPDRLAVLVYGVAWHTLFLVPISEPQQRCRLECSTSTVFFVRTTPPGLPPACQGIVWRTQPVMHGRGGFKANGSGQFFINQQSPAVLSSARQRGQGIRASVQDVTITSSSRTRQNARSPRDSAGAWYGP